MSDLGQRTGVQVLQDEIVRTEQLIEDLLSQARTTVELSVTDFHDRAYFLMGRLIGLKNTIDEVLHHHDRLERLRASLRAFEEGP